MDFYKSTTTVGLAMSHTRNRNHLNFYYHCTFNEDGEALRHNFNECPKFPEEETKRRIGPFKTFGLKTQAKGRLKSDEIP